MIIQKLLIIQCVYKQICSNKDNNGVYKKMEVMQKLQKYVLKIFVLFAVKKNFVKFSKFSP